MARIADEVIERLKREVSLVRLVESRGVELKPHGGDWIGRCPFHDDKTPSLVVSPDANLWHCLGACNAGGSVIDWVMKTQGISFRHAVELLRADQPLAAVDKPARRSTTKKLEVLLSDDTEAQQLLNQVVDYYHDTLKQSPEALAYLERRGLGDAELIDRFKLGYANRTLGYRLPEKTRKAGAAVRGTLQAIGLLRDSGHEHFNGSIVVPVFAADGNVVEIYGRKINDNLRKGTATHLYLPGPHAGVWNAAGLVDQKEVILCEALIDAMTLWVNGYRNVTASYGTSGFTDDHLNLFKQHGIERVLLAYDRDEAGNAAALKLANRLQAEGFACYRLNFPKGMDVNAYALEVTPASKSLGIVIRSAEWLGEGAAPKRDAGALPTSPCSADVDEVQHVDPPLAASPLAAEPTSDATVIVPPAAALPEAPAEPVAPDVQDHDVHFTFGERRYRIRGLEKNKNYEVLKINVLVSLDDNLHVDTFDLYAAKARQGFVKVAALELGVEEAVIKKDLGQVLLQLEALQEQQIEDVAPIVPALSDHEQTEALELLRDPDLLHRICSDFSRCGIVGEGTNTLVGYLAASSRKLERPLAVIIQSTSAAGKSSLMEAVLALMPESDRVQYSAMTGQSLFYLGETDLKHRILAIAEEEGASQAGYALKLLQSDGEITIASTGKDDTTGDLVTKTYRVEGPVMLFLTTTAIDIDEELLNRCLVLTVNESREQTRAIHAAQRQKRTLSGLTVRLERQQLIQLHRNAQTLLRPLAVINPYADQLTFLDDKTRTRRDHEKYLTLIDSIALLHQHQRAVKTIQHAGNTLEYVEVQISDIETANRLAHEVLGRTLDELPPQTRKLLSLIQAWVLAECDRQSMSQRDCRFSRRDIRAVTRWSDTALKVHMARLVELEYLLVHREGRGQRYEYELLYDQADGDGQYLMGLIDVEKLRCDADRSGQSEQQSAPGQGPVSGRSDPPASMEPNEHQASLETGPNHRERVSAAKSKTPSYRSAIAG